MFIGHFAVALGAKRAAPRVSLGVLFAACQLPDLLWPVLLLLGWERVAITPAGNPFLNLTFTSYPWSHSLLANLVWAVLAGLVYRAVTGNGRGALVVGLVVLSHWVLDLATHRPDLPLYPGGAKVGLGLWNSVVGTLVVEVAMFVAGLWLYLGSTRASDGVGRFGFWALVLLIVLVYLSSFTSPPPASVAALTGFGMAGWLPPFWAWWVDRHRVRRYSAE
jgi:hypothetical protein